MSASISSCLDVDVTVPAVVEWENEDVTHYLARPDPKVDNITLKIRINDSRALVELRLPINLKGVNSLSVVIVSVQPSSIASFNSTSVSTVPEAVQDKFSGPITRLNFQVNKCLEMLAPKAIKEPLAPTRSQSGIVLDALRTLIGVTSFSVYIEAAKLSKSQLQYISDAVSQSRLTPSHDQHDLASMYRGAGAKIVHLSSQIQDAPPSYDETEPPPPAAPFNEKKRRRVDSEHGDNDIVRIWAELKARDERDRLVQQELSALKQENRSLKEDLGQLRQQVTTFHNDLSTLKQDVEQLQGQDTQNSLVLEGYDTRIVELRDDLEDLDAKVDSIQEHRDENGVAQSFLDKVRSDVYDDIVSRLTG
ncbi:hypothetical protein FHETE_5904 [Fusarium heterosporum]|uniref:Uncharacterized protein n=1 Tax=Fusarium heterosporum TaxID=42747 RepID=A0A8H5WPA8_FUSHE|nr:hypothetical protein FHETE_5904 [Fusarium heterosporum]